MRNATCSITTVVHVYNVRLCTLSSPVAVDASAAGKGQLEIDSDLPIRDYKPLGDRVFLVKYVAKRVGAHELNVKYNGIVVEGW